MGGAISGFVLWATAVGAGAAQTDGIIIPVRPADVGLNSLRALPDGTLLYSDNLGVFRVRWGQAETLLTNPVSGGYCVKPFPGGICIEYAPLVYHPKAMAADSGGTVYIADPELHLIERYDEASRQFATVLTGAGSPTALIAADDGSVYFNDPDGCRILRLREGAVETVAGTGVCGYTNDGGPATTAQIRSVRAMALDAASRMFIADDVGDVVRSVDTDGTIWTIAGLGTPETDGEGVPANQAMLLGPVGLAADGEGNLFIAETKGNRVRVVGADGLIRTVAGTGAAGSTGDDGPARQALLNGPTCLAVSLEETLVVCDAGVNRIREVVPMASGRWVVPALDAYGAAVGQSAPGAMSRRYTAS